MTRKFDTALIALLIVSLSLLAIGAYTKNAAIVAGVTGLIATWFLCIDKLIAHTLSLAAKIGLIVFVVAVPVAATALLA
jgi:hypothetical protein